MNDTQPGTSRLALPNDPVMAASNPAMFALLTTGENQILSHHLTSGWYKQAAVYPTLSEPWKETSVVLGDLHRAHQAAYRQAEHEPEAGQ
jgi:hypothetical protein